MYNLQICTCKDTIANIDLLQLMK